jgi:hypothetical protein
MKGYIPETKDVTVLGVTVVDFELWVEEQEPPMGTVKGTVTDYNNGEPIEGALVDIEYNDHRRATRTDENGQYMFENVPKDLGPAKISVSMEKYRPESKEIVVEDKNLVDFELWIEEQEPPQYEGIITGIVTDVHDDKPIAGAQMTLEYHGLTRKSTTDAEGQYTFNGVPICFCLKKISVSMDGYKPQSKEVGVDKLTVVDFALMTELEPVPADDGGSEKSPSITGGSKAPAISMGPAIVAVGGLLAIISALVMFSLVLSSRRRERTREEQ